MLARLFRRLGHRPWFAAVGSRLLPRLDRAAYTVSGHRWTVTDIAFPTLLLHCDGARPVPLLHARDGDDYLVAATNWGRPEHPRWSDRLLRNPLAAIEERGHRRSVVAQLLAPAEVSAMWPRLLEVWPAFEDYRRRARRDIRVFRLTPD